MNYQIRDSYAPIKSTQLETLQNKYRFVFPKEYREFLLKFNGGKIEPRNFNFQVDGYEGDAYLDSRIDWFLAIHDGPYDNFEIYLKTYKINSQRIPENFIPIAHDDGGNLICLSVSSEDTGSVYFWDHEYEEEGDNFFLIKSGFNDFINSLF